MEKSTSTAPARVPVAIKGDAAPGDQAKVAVLGISLRRTIVREGKARGIVELVSTNGIEESSKGCEEIRPHPFIELTSGSRYFVVNQVAFWAWRDRGTCARPDQDLAKHILRLGARDISSLSHPTFEY